MKVLITGSSGYFGSLLTNYLVSGGTRVIGIDIRDPAEKHPSSFFKFYNCCITDKESLQKIFSTGQPTHVVHFACTCNKLRNSKKEYLTDVGGSGNLLDIVNSTGSVRQLLFASSAAVYGGFPDNPEWISEAHEPRPGKYTYGVNKKIIENLFINGKRPDLRVVIARICTLSGPSYSSERVLLRLITAFPVFPEFYRNNKLQLLHEDDFVRLLEMIITDDEIEGIFNVASDSCSYISDLSPDKKYLRLPKTLLKSVMWLLWTLKIFNLQPASLNSSIYPIVLDPGKIKSRYGYEFGYTTEKAFNEIKDRFRK